MARRWALALAGVAALTAGPGYGAIPSDMPTFMHPWIWTGVTTDSFVASLRAVFRKASGGRETLDRKAARDAVRAATAEARAASLRAVMRYDLDGDLSVSGHEARRALETTDPFSRVARLSVLDLAWFDTNADGVVTAREAASGGPIHSAGLMRSAEAARWLMATPAARDGALTEAEVVASATTVFRELDKDGDGGLSALEVETARAKRSPTRSPPPCRLPRLRDEELVLIGVAEGGGPPGAAGSPRVRSVTVRVPRGDRPLYLVAASGLPARWVLTGDKRHVARLVALQTDNSRKDGLSEIAGLEFPLAQVRPAEGCFDSFVDVNDPTAKASADRLKALLGRSPDKILAAVSPQALVIPSKPERIRRTVRSSGLPFEGEWDLVGNPYRSRITLKLTPTSLSARVGCTSFGASIVMNSEQLDLDDGVIFEAPCHDSERGDPAANAYWNQVLQRLQGASTFKSRSRRLTLTDAQGRRLVFRRQ